MDVKKSFIIACLVLMIMMIVGGVSASEDIDSISSSGDLNETLEVNEIDEGDNLATDGSDSDGGNLKAIEDNDSIEVNNDFLSDNQDVELLKEDKDIVLGASVDEDVLTGTIYDTGIGNTYADLRAFLTATGNRNNDFVLTHDYIGTGDEISTRYILSLTGNKDGNGGPIVIDHSNANARVLNIYQGQTITISNIIFKNSKPDNTFGGAVYVNQNANVTFINCSFEDNTITRIGTTHGGAAVYFATKCIAKFQNCSFKRNHLEVQDLTLNPDIASHGGGAIYFTDSKNAQFIGCDFDSNWIISNRNHCRLYGGAIFYNGNAENNNFTNCTFENNYLEGLAADGHEDQPHGAAIKFKGTTKNIKFEGCNFTNNTAYTINSDYAAEKYKTSGGGGAVCFLGASQNITFKKSKFINNTLNITGICVYAYGGAVAFLNTLSTLTINDTDFIDNQIYATNPYDTKEAHSVTSFGGALYIKTAVKDITIEGSNFTSNHALLGENGKSMTGAIYFGGTSLQTITIKDTEFAKNTASDDYPVLTFLVPVDNCNFTNVTFKNNNGTTAPLYFGNTVKNTNVVNCTFKDNENSATTDSNGGGIYVQNATSLNITGSTFDHNTVGNNGGALYVNSGSGVSVDNCTFANHHVDTYGGAIYWADGDFITNNSRFINNSAAEGPNIYFAGETNVTSFSNTVFINSTTTAGDGGAVSIPASANTKNVTFYKCTFDNNNANSTNSNGGAIAISSGSTFINITGSNFTNNGADNGGAIYLNEANATISGSTFSNNHATDDEKGNDILLTNNAKVTEISGSEFKGTNNIYNDGGEVTLKNNEQNSDGTGYFIENKGSLSLEGNTFKSVVINNGGISSHVFINISGNTTHTCDDYIFYLNATITDNEGNIIISPTLTYSTYDNLTIEAADNETHDANFTTLFNEHKTYLVTASDPNLSNRTVGISIVNVILREGTYTWLQDKMDNLVGNDLDLNVTVTFDPYYDLSIHNKYNGSVNFTTGMRYNKTINFNGNGFTISGLNQARIFYITVRGVNITDTAFENANSTDNGGALYLSSLSGNVYINDCNFTNNNAKAGGAIYYVPSGNVKNITIENCRFENNNAFGDQTVDIIDDKNHTKGNGAGCGGAVHLNGENHKLIGNEFISNNVKGNNAYGGAVYLAGSGHSLLNNNFTDNGADNSQSNGGAVYSYANSVNITNNRFIDNHARVWGGAFVDGYGTSNLKIENSTFIANTAKNAGAVDLYETPYATIYNCLFDDNRASNKAGALYMNGLNGVVSYCNFTNNKANYSSAISYTPDDPTFVDPTKANITHCNFINNIADVTGTVRFDSCEGNINYCNFTNNTAGSAGAIYVCMKDVTIEHCNFNGNNATNGNGGAIWTDSSYDNTSIRYCEFTNNRASGDGAAVYLANKDNKLVGCDFTNNAAAGNGGAIYATGDNINVSDSTFSKNTADNGGAIYYQNSGNNLCIYNDTFKDNVAEFNGGAVYYNALRDYNNFDGNAIPVDATSKRVSWDDAGKQVIFTSLFENNKDYLMNASAIVTNTVTINVAVPKGVSGYTINITVSNGTVVTVTKTDGQPSEVDGHTVIPVYLAGLEDGKYNATVGFRQGDVYLYKEVKVQFTVGNPTEGAFTTLQKLIDDALEQARTSGNPAVVDLTEAVIYTQGKDNGQINITGPITINGHNLVIDALGLSRIFDIRSEGVILNDILFKGGNASGADSTSADKVNGDAILWEGANGVINNCKFEDHAGSSTVYVLNSNNFLVNDTEFKDNNCSPISVSSSNGTIANSTFTDNTGEMIIAGDSLVTVSASTFESTGISVNSGEKVTLYNITLTNSNVGISSDVEMEDIRATSSAVDFNDGNSSVVASSFSGANPITVAAAAEVHLTKVNTTAETTSVSVLNKGTLYLNGNKFGNVIDNVNGQIKSSTTVWVLNNSTVISKAGKNVQLNASIVDDSNNIIKVGNLIFTLNGVSAGNGQLQDNGNYTVMYTSIKGVYVVSVNDTANNDFGLTDPVYKTAVLKVKVDPADVGELTLDINQQNQIVTIKAIFADDETGNVTFVVKGNTTSALINKTVKINETTRVATLTLSNLLPDDYAVTATYMGDDTHFKGTPQVDSFTVLRQASNIAIKVNDSLCGQDAIAVITTNATGNVTIIFGDQIKKVEITNGRYEWNLSNSLAPRFYTISAYFEANPLADSSFTSSNFTVYNYTVDVTVSETQFNQSANITVTIAPQQAIGSQPPVIRLDDEILSIVSSENGVYVATTGKLTKVGQHTVNVTYAGNGTLFYPKEIIKTFNVSANDEYEFHVEIIEKPYGENTTIVVTGPAGVNVTVNVDGVNYTVTVGDDGKGNLTLDNLTAGNHKVVANFTGNDNYTGKSVTKDINVPQQTPDIQVIVPENIAPGSPSNVTIVVGKNATGKAIVTIDNVPTQVIIKNGTAIVPIPTDKPGSHNITVEYFGDKNYAAPDTVTKANYTVDKYTPEIIIKEPIVNDNNSVVVVVEMDPSDATGNVTVTLANGTEVTVNLTKGRAEVPVGILPVNGTMAYNVTYSGDSKYNKTSKVSADNLTVGKLNNFTVDVDIIEGQYGENTTVVVSVTPGVGGNVSVVVDNVTYPVTPDAQGNYVAIIPPLDLGSHNVTVKFENSSNYDDKVVNKTFEVEKNDKYDISVNVTEAEFGENTTIEITAPKGIGVVNVTIDGANYTVTINETTGKGVLNISNLTAGTHKVETSFQGNEYYAPISTTNIINVPKAQSAMNITVDNQGPGKNVTVTVDVGPNATGVVCVDVNGNKHYVEVDENGTATYVIENAAPGDYNITTTFGGDDNYAKVNNTYNFTVDKKDAVINIKEPIVNDNNSVVVVVEMDPSDATGNVTVTLANGTEVTVNLTKGRAEVPVGVLPVNGTMAYNVTYSGDKNYNKTTVVSADNLTVGRLNNFTVDVDIIEGQYGENTTVVVSVTPGVGGDIAVVVDNVTYPVTPDAQGNYVAIIPPSTVGTHNVTVKFENSSNYDDKVVNKTFEVEKNDHYDVNITISPNPAKFGENTTIEVEIPEGMDNVTVVIDGKEIVVPVDPTTGKGELVINNLTFGDHNITVVTPGNDNYESVSNTTSISIEKAVSDLNMTISEIRPGENVTVTVDVGPNATGHVTVTVNGQEKTVPVGSDGKATYVIPNVAPGDLNITASFLGDGNYEPVVKSVNTTVPKYPSSIEILEPEITKDNNVTVVVKVNATDAGGKVTVTVGGENYTADVVNGIAKVNIGVVEPNTTPVMNVTYSGDKKYNGTELKSVDSVKVGPLNNFTADIEIIPGQYGENTTVKVTVPDDATGNITVTVDGKDYPVVKDQNGTYVAQVPSDVVGNHTVKVSYTNDPRYNETEINKTFEVEKNDHYDVNITISPNPAKFGENTTIDVEIPEGMDNVTVVIDGKEIVVPVDPTTGKGELVINNLTFGDHNITVVTPGNDKYAPVSNTTSISIEKAVSDLNMTISEIRPGENVTVTVDVGPNATGHVTVTVNGQEKTVPVGSDGKVTYVIPNVAPGDLNITASFLGDGNYEPVVKSVNTTVPKYPSSIEILEPEITKDNNVTVVVKVNATDASGKVTVTVGGENYTADVVNGIAKVNIGVVEPNTTPVMNVTYSGDKKYNGTELKSVDSVKVGPLNNFTADIEIIPGQYGENTTVKVTVPDDATGNITVTVDGKDYPVVKDENGTYVAQVPSDVVGNHTVKVSYTNDPRYNETEINKTFEVEKNDHYDVNITVTPNPAKFGENTTIDVEIPEGMDNVTVVIDGKEIVVPVDPTTGKGQLVIDDLPFGDHNVTVVTPGNDKYAPVSNTTSISIEKAVSDLNMTISEIRPGENVTVTVDVGPNATGHVTVTVNGQEKTVPVGSDGKVTYVIPNVAPGDLNITASFLGDGNYEPVVKSVNTTVPKYPTSMEILEPEITKDNNVTVVVKVNATDAGGKVTVTVGGENYTADVVNGIAKVNIGVVEPNTTPVMNVTYSGDKKYNGTELKSVDSVKVGPLNNFTADIEIIPGQYGENTTVKVTVPDDAAGNITVTVDGKDYPVVKDENGTYVAQVPSDVVGNHTVKVSYTGDPRYNETEINKTFEVEKNDHYDVNVTIIPIPTEFGVNTTIDVEIPEGMDNVTVVIDGKEIFVPVDPTTGKGQLVVGNLTAGDHTVSVVTPGNENYAPVTETTSVSVAQATSDMVIAFVGGEPGEDLAVVVNVGPNATGHVVITVNGQEHTVPVGEDGTATYVIPDAQPGDYNITAQFLGDNNYKSAKNNVSTTVPKFPSSIEVLEPVIGNDNNVTVVVKVNATDASGKVTVTVGGENYTADVVNGIAKVNIGTVEPNTTPVMNITYSGDDKYAESGLQSVDSVKVGPLNNFTADIEIIPGQYGENTTVKVTVPDDAAGNITVTVDGKDYPIVKDENGTYIAQIPSDVVGNHTVKVSYTDDPRYNNTEITKTYTVDPNSNYPFDVTVTPAPFGEDTVINVTGPVGTNVTVNVDGVNYTVTVGDDGKGNLTLNNLTAGPHDISVNFEGNENYTEKSVSEKFTVPKQTPDIKVNITPAEPIAPGSDVNVTISVGNNAAGTVYVTVDGVTTPVEVKNGTAVVPIMSSQPGTHEVSVIYSGDDNYNSQSTVTQANFTVQTYEPTVEVIGVERDENNNVTVAVKVNGTGNVTVKIGDKTYNATVEDGVAKVNIGDVPVGPQDINITYSGDENFGPTSVVEHIDAPVLTSYNLTVTKDDIKYGEPAQINVTIPDDADPSKVKVYVDGEPVDASHIAVVGNVVQVTVDGLNAGSHPVEVVYEGDDKYGRLSNSTNIGVEKATLVDPEINITAPIEVGQPVEITVKLPEDANGTITVNVNGAKYTYDLVNGSVNISIPNLGDGSYDINVTYSGDENYDPITVSEKVDVVKVVPAISADAANITVGQNAVIEVTVPDDATGNVTIKIGDIEQTTPVHGGVNQISVPGVPVGENQEVAVTYNGNDKYAPNSNKTSLTVNPKPTSPDDIKVIDNGDGTITVTVPDNATGDITVKIGNETLPAASLKDGKAVINLTESSAKPGKHNITVAYSGDENHTAVEVNSSSEIPKWDSTANVTVSKIREGDNATVTVEVSPAGATGKVYAEVNGNTYAAEIGDDGKAVINIPGLKEGTQDIKVTYGGDDNYNGFTEQTKVVVEEPITATVNGTGADSQVIINLPENATKNVTAFIDGEKVPVVFDENGTATVNLSDVKPGRHNLTVVYVDENNNTSVVNTQINVPKWPSSVNATAPTIREGDSLPVTVTVGSPDMTGLVLVDINGTGYYANLTNGKVVINAPGLKEGVYDANVTYLGDDKYLNATNTFSFAVEAPITIDVNGAGNSSQIIVDLPANGTGNVTVLVDGKEVPVNITNGTAVADLNNITAGEHNVTVIYTDKYGTQSVVNTTIKIYNSINANNMTRGWNSPYDYEAEFLDKDGHVLANTTMEFKIDGKTYRVTTDNKGIAKLTDSHLAVGQYDVEITNTLTNEKLTKSVNIVERLINNKDMTMDFADGSKYTVTAIGDDGKPVAAGEIVGISVNGKSYVGITDKNGVARLTINLNPAKYTITSKYAGYNVSNKLVVKQVLKLVKKTVKVKKSAKKLVIKAKLKKSNGKAIKGKKLTLKFKGKTYKAKTNKKGIAKFTIKKKVIKKLKKGKKYSYTVAYKTDKVKGKVKVKK